MMNSQEIDEIIQHLENARYIGASKAVTIIHQLNKERSCLSQRVLDLEERISNMEQWEKRYLDVIESLSQDSKAALDPALRTYDGKLE